MKAFRKAFRKTVQKQTRARKRRTEGVADTIWRQIPTSTKMACGARNPVGGGNKLHFNVGRGNTQKIEVEYRPGMDLYTVKLWKFSRDYLDQKVVKQIDNVYAEDLGEVIYRMVNK